MNLSEISKEIRDWLAALGTVGAVIVALWLAGRASRQARCAEMRRAGLYAASVVNQLAMARTLFSRLEVHCAMRNHNVTQEESDIQTIQKVSDELMAFRFVPSTEALLGMTALPNNCANRIARAFDLTERIRHQIQHYTASPNSRLYADNALRRGIVENWEKTLMEATSLLDAAIKECVKASNLAAPVPTTEERYGDLGE